MANNEITRNENIEILQKSENSVPHIYTLAEQEAKMSDVLYPQSYLHDRLVPYPIINKNFQ
jgi:hypothetical protein